MSIAVSALEAPTQDSLEEWLNTSPRKTITDKLDF